MPHHASKSARRRALIEKAFPEQEPEFQIAPMVDILLVLLVFFMAISSTEVLQASKELTLPVAADARRPREHPGQVIVNVTWNPALHTGSIFVDENQIATPRDLIPMLRNRIAQNPTTRVLLRADKQVRYEYMRTVLRAVGDAGVSNITFSVADKDSRQP